MIASFLLSLREGIEAALVIGIVLGVLSKFNRSDLNGMVWRGLGAAIAASLLAAVGLNLLGLEFEGTGEQIFEGVAMLFAAGLLTWMILWMQKTSHNLKGEIESKTLKAAQGGGKAIFVLVFLAVVREGIELALFLLAVEQATSLLQTLIGALMGLSIAAGLGWLLFASTRKLNLRMFFRVTNVLLIIFAAGLVGLGVHELNEAHIIPPVIETVWNLNFLVSDESQLGLLLKALVGYHATPSLTEVIAYLSYIGLIGLYIFAQKKSAPAIAEGAAN